MIRSSRSPGVMISVPGCSSRSALRARHGADADPRDAPPLVLRPGDELALQPQAGLVDRRLVELRVHRNHAEQRQAQLGQAERGVLLQHRHLFRHDLVDDRADDLHALLFKEREVQADLIDGPADARRG